MDNSSNKIFGKSRLNNNDYTQLMKLIRPYVSFDYNLNDIKKLGLENSQKAELRKYYSEIKNLTARTHQVYRARSPKNLKLAQNQSGHSSNLKYMKVAFVPTNGEKSRIRVNNKQGKIIVTTGNVIHERLAFDVKRLARNTEKHVLDTIKKAPDAKEFTIRVGEEGIFEIRAKTFKRADVSQGVINLMNSYSDKKQNNFWQNWLYGVEAYKFKNQKSFNEYRREWSKKTRSLKQQKKRQSQRLRRKQR